jgi:undecaprenyl-diphosphatase
MNEFIAIFYGLVQGVSEFLPISSSGHLALIPHYLKFDDPGVAFDLALHLGTALAVILYFHRKLIEQIKNLPNLFKKDTKSNLTRFLVTGTIASLMLILILKPFSEIFRQPLFIAINLAFFGFVLWISHRNYIGKNELNFKSSILIGLAQALAIFPGVSRSGITLSCAFFMGIKKEEAGEYSFLLSLPIILGGALKLVPDLLTSNSDVSFSYLMIGIISSFVFGILTIHFFLKLLTKINFAYFFLYRVLIAILVFVYLV